MRRINLKIWQGKGDRSKYLYGQINDAETGELIISASAKYCSEAIRERNYVIVKFNVEE